MIVTDFKYEPKSMMPGLGEVSLSFDGQVVCILDLLVDESGKIATVFKLQALASNEIVRLAIASLLHPGGPLQIIRTVEVHSDEDLLWWTDIMCMDDDTKVKRFRVESREPQLVDGSEITRRFWAITNSTDKLFNSLDKPDQYVLIRLPYTDVI
jgi:hypothetical protein